MATTDTLEGRLLAQRKLLARIVAALKSDELDKFLSDRDHYDGHEEDPGSDPDGSYALEAALADELRLLSEEVARLRKG
ncbi:hypothetical protein [Pelagovum pacificum]|uniref:Uncharacterized protein n=1 Tax=Pelagovum pacificum TaxID=2588711 RepID=A0A5C5G9H2_9RHOB|nr:hypothetical protein [Pelagovum pacificum]QQA42135.1 hypothetical protein I8N54_15240 [Pelagovum pacificum]TNY31223.1 hypothetical protein FHY64_14425 [Pelagovum pacificum]